MTKWSWVQTPTDATIFQAPFIWIKAWNKNCGRALTWHCFMCCNLANGRVDFEEWLAYKNPSACHIMNYKLVSQLRPKSPQKTKKINHVILYYLHFEIQNNWKFIWYSPQWSQIIIYQDFLTQCAQFSKIVSSKTGIYQCASFISNEANSK